jgi:type II secretory pathway pseudopilin PulG
MHGSRRFAPGITLVEMLAALAILGTILTGLVLAMSRHRTQWHDANRKLEAVRATQHLLNTRWDKTKEIPASGSGDLEHAEGLRWRTRPSADATRREDEPRLIQLTVRGEEQAPEAEALVRVPLFLPPKEENESGDADGSG